LELIAELRIHQPIFSKARPRVTRNGVFMPKAYQDKRKAMLASIKEQYTGDPLEGPLRVEVNVKGEGRADGDNIVGALFDCANGVLWKDDRISIIPQLEVRWTKAPKAESLWIIRIYQLVE